MRRFRRLRDFVDRFLRQINCRLREIGIDTYSGTWVLKFPFNTNTVNVNTIFGPFKGFSIYVTLVGVVNGKVNPSDRQEIPGKA